MLSPDQLWQMRQDAVALGSGLSKSTQGGYSNGHFDNSDGKTSVCPLGEIADRNDLSKGLFSFGRRTPKGVPPDIFQGKRDPSGPERKQMSQLDRHYGKLKPLDSKDPVQHQIHDYSHILNESVRGQGIGLHVRHYGNGRVSARISHNGQPMRSVYGTIKDNKLHLDPGLTPHDHISTAALYGLAHHARRAGAHSLVSDPGAHEVAHQAGLNWRHHAQKPVAAAAAVPKDEPKFGAKPVSRSWMQPSAEQHSRKPKNSGFFGDSSISVPPAAGPHGTAKQASPSYIPQHQRPGFGKAELFLRKMAKIHHDTKKPMTVYRVQDKHGEGPYGDSGMMSGIPQAKVDLPDRGNKDYHQPLPENDFDEADLHELHGQDPDTGNGAGYYRFGFCRPEDATRWFGHDGIEELYRQGYRVKEVPASRVHQSVSGKQVFFEHAPKGWGRWRNARGFDHPKVKKAELVKSKNVRQQTDYHTLGHAGRTRRFAEYARRLGLNPVSSRTWSPLVGHPPEQPAAPNDILHEGSGNFTLQHELAHAAAAPAGKPYQRYLDQLTEATDRYAHGPSRRWAYREESVAQEAEPLLGRRSGVRVPHFDPRGSEKESLEWLGRDRAAARERVARFDAGARFNQDGKVQEPQGIDAKISQRQPGSFARKREVRPETGAPPAGAVLDKTKKAELSPKPAPTRSNLHLPVGTIVEGPGKVKVRDAQGREKWREARAGLTMGQQPATAAAEFGLPTSILRPGG